MGQGLPGTQYCLPVYTPAYSPACLIAVAALMWDMVTQKPQKARVRGFCLLLVKTHVIEAPVLGKAALK